MFQRNQSTSRRFVCNGLWKLIFFNLILSVRVFHASTVSINCTNISLMSWIKVTNTFSSWSSCNMLIMINKSCISLLRSYLGLVFFLLKMEEWRSQEANKMEKCARRREWWWGICTNVNYKNNKLPRIKQKLEKEICESEDLNYQYQYSFYFWILFPQFVTHILDLI